MPMFVLYLLHGVKGKLDPGQNRMDVLKAVQELDDNAEIKYLSFMFESYQPKYWWFEVAEVYRRIALKRRMSTRVTVSDCRDV